MTTTTIIITSVVFESPPSLVFVVLEDVGVAEVSTDDIATVTDALSLFCAAITYNTYVIL